MDSTSRTSHGLNLGGETMFTSTKFKGLHESVGVFFSCPRVYCKPPKFLQNESHSIRIVYPDDMGVEFTGMFNMFSPRSRIPPVVDIGARDDIIIRNGHHPSEMSRPLLFFIFFVSDTQGCTSLWAARRRSLAPPSSTSRHPS
jgi:hypothetical protein